MNIDRTLQNRILHCLKTVYPMPVQATLIYRSCIEGLPFPDFSDFDASLKAFSDFPKNREMMMHLDENLIYLTEHQLLEMKSDGSFRITAKGCDFIEEDGGLSAILNVTRVEFTENAIALIKQALDQTTLDPVHKHKWLDELKSLPAESIKQILVDLICKGVARFPEVLSSIQM
ncbi:hypothetical protein [Actinobacillus porcinus]|uniref:hypothetical protein n=1 Tax=Actinobacillus porcinus TaxID=51048 RepID=UPI0023578971|nr:hypothetical protein [Actinobacillus porcinus]